MERIRKYEGIEVLGKTYKVRVEVERHNRDGSAIYWVDPGTGCPPIPNADLHVGLDWAAAEIASKLLR